MYSISPFLIIDDRQGIKVHAEIVYIRPIMGRCSWIHIVTDDLLDLSRYIATYDTGKRAIKGFYSVFTSEKADGKWLFKGLFEGEKDSKSRARYLT